VSASDDGKIDAHTHRTKAVL